MPPSHHRQLLMDKFFTVLENKTGIDTGNTGETYKATPPQSPHSKRNTQLSKRLPTLTGNAGAELAAFALAYQCFVEREDPDQAEELLGLEKAPNNICFFLGDLAEKSEAGVLPTDKLSILKLNGYVILIRHIIISLEPPPLPNQVVSIMELITYVATHLAEVFHLS